MLLEGFYWKINFSEEFATCGMCKLFLFQNTKPSAGSNNILYATTFACQQEMTKHWSCNLEGIWGPCQGREPMEPWKLLFQYTRTNITKTQMSGRRPSCKVQLGVWKSRMQNLLQFCDGKNWLSMFPAHQSIMLSVYLKLKVVLSWGICRVHSSHVTTFAWISEQS
jgi:hypothetical protein